MVAVCVFVGCADERHVGARRSAIVAATDVAADDAAVAIVTREQTCGAPDARAVVCTGTLVASNVVLTAAHCLGDGPAAALDIVVGADVATGERVHVASGAAHPAYDEASHENDVAVLVLARPLAFAPVAMASSMPSVGSLVRAVGFGARTAAGDEGGTRQEGTLRLDAIGVDDLRLGPAPSMTCRGDSGGPIFDAAGALVGVTTWGDPACKEVGYGARVDRMRAFIDPYLSQPDAAARSSFSPDEDLCARTCRTDDDCPTETSCLEGRCSYAGLPPGRFGAGCSMSGACPGESACIALPLGCRCLTPCGGFEVPDAGSDGADAPGKSVETALGGGCTFGGSNGPRPALMPWLSLVPLLTLLTFLTLLTSRTRRPRRFR